MRFLVSLVVAFWTALPLHAATFTYTFEGTVTQLDAPGGQGLFGAPGTVSIGDMFSGSFSYVTGPANPDQFGNAESGFYLLNSFVVNESTLIFTPTSAVVQVSTIPALPPVTPAPDRLRFGADVNTTAYGGRVSMRMFAPQGTLPDDSLPEPIQPAFFSNATLQGVNAVGLSPAPSLGDFGAITSIELVPNVVPLPASVFGLLFGCFSLFALRRRVRNSV